MKTKEDEYIIKAKEVYFYKENKVAQLIAAVLIGIFDIYIWFQCLSNKWYLIGGILFVLILILAVIVANIKYSIELKERNVYIHRFFRKYKINYNDLILFKKVTERTYDDNGNAREVYYLFIMYLHNNKIKVVKDNYWLKGDEIDEVCHNFITNKELELINEMNVMDRLDIINREYFDIERNVDDDVLKNTVINYYETQKKLKVIIVIIGIVIFMSMLIIAKIIHIL